MDPGTATSDKPGDPHADRRIDARPNDTDGTVPDEPGTMQAASALARPIIGRRLTEHEKEVGGPIVHYLFGAAAGAVYGAVAEVDSSVTIGGGIGYGFTVWLIADEVGMHAAGFASSPAEYPLSRHAATLGTHLVFGVTLEAIRRALRGSRSRSSFSGRAEAGSEGQEGASSESEGGAARPGEESESGRGL
jgi:putative membrane protein